MRALEQFEVTKPDPFATRPFHPQTMLDIKGLQVMDLPEARKEFEGWMKTGFEIAGDVRFLREILLERFHQKVAVGYAFDSNEGVVVEYLKQATEIL